MGGVDLVNIRSVHAYMANTLLKNLAITLPRAATIKRVYPYIPSPRTPLTDLPCAMLTFEQKPVVFHSALMHRDYGINVRVVTGKVEPDGIIAAEMAASFLDAIITACSGAITLGGTVSLIQQLRGQSPETLVLWEWAGIGYVGLDLFLDVRLSESIQHSA